jgi:ferredoxin
MGDRKSIYTPFPQAVPRIPVIDVDSCRWFKQQKCKVCQKVCPTEAIDYEQKDEVLELEVGNIVMATGWKMFDCRGLPQYGHGRLANVYSSLEFERLCNAAGPTGGKILLRDGITEPKSVAIIHCVGSRDTSHNEYCSGICCMAALKFGHLVLEKTQAEVYSFYIDMRANQKGYEEFYQRLLEEGMHFVRGKVAEVTDAARMPDGRGPADRPGGRHALGQAAADPGGHGDPDGGAGAAGRRQGDGPEVRHLLQHGRLVHGASSQARPGGHDDRRRCLSPARARAPRTFPPRWPKAPRPPRGSPA